MRDADTQQPRTARGDISLPSRPRPDYGVGLGLQYGALDFPPLFPLDVPVGGAAVVRLARPDLAHQVKEHLHRTLRHTPTHTGPPPTHPHTHRTRDTTGAVITNME